MFSKASQELAESARAIYDGRLRSQLEATHPDEFVAIEVESGDYFLGSTLSEAIQAARAVYPDRYPFALRVGHSTTVHVGVLNP